MPTTDVLILQHSCSRLMLVTRTSSTNKQKNAQMLNEITDKMIFRQLMM